jgi:DME family drug/metabolite transporter
VTASGGRALGIAMVLGAAALWGTTGTAQHLGSGTVPSVWVGAWRLAAAGVFFALWLALTERRAVADGGLARLPWAWIAAAAACMTAYNLAFFAGVRGAGVAVGTAVALGSGPLWAGLLQAAVTRRLPGATWFGGTALAVAGGAAMILDGHDGSRPATVLGLVLCLAAGLSYAAYAQVNQRIVQTPGCSPGLATGAIFLLAAAVAWPLAGAMAGTPQATARDLLVVAWLGVMSTGVAYLLLSQALRRISSPTAVTLSLAEPVTAFALALVVVGERPGAIAFAGLAAVLAGLAVVMRGELRGR